MTSSLVVPEPLDYSLFLRYTHSCVMCRNGKERLICFEPTFGVDVRSLAAIEIPGDHRGYPLRSPGICRGYRRGRARDAVAKSFASGDSLKTYPRTKNVVRYRLVNSGTRGVPRLIFDDHSSRRVVTGSTRVARYAGITLARKLTSTSSRDTAVKVSRSVGLTP